MDHQNPSCPWVLDDNVLAVERNLAGTPGGRHLVHTLTTIFWDSTERHVRPHTGERASGGFNDRHVIAMRAHLHQNSGVAATDRARDPAFGACQTGPTAVRCCETLGSGRRSSLTPIHRGGRREQVLEDSATNPDSTHGGLDVHPLDLSGLPPNPTEATVVQPVGQTTRRFCCRARSHSVAPTPLLTQERTHNSEGVAFPLLESIDKCHVCSRYMRDGRAAVSLRSRARESDRRARGRPRRTPTPPPHTAIRPRPRSRR